MTSHDVLALDGRSNEVAELSVLGGVVLDPNSLALVRPRLSPEDFYFPAHCTIWRAILDLDANGNPFDLQAIYEWLRAADKLKAVEERVPLMKLTDYANTGENLEYQVSIVADLSMARRVAREASVVLVKARDSSVPPEDLARDAVAAMSRATQRRGEAGEASMLVCATEFYEQLEAIGRRGYGISGAPTGIRSLDAATTGLHPENLIVIAARPAMGKSALSMCMAQAVAKTRRDVVVFSLEMSRVALFQRMVCEAARIDSTKIRRGDLSQVDMDRLTAATQQLAKLPISIVSNTTVTVDDIRARCHAIHARNPLGVVVVDYLQLIKPVPGRSESRERDVAEMSRALKNLASELSVPVVLLSQLNRKCEERADKRPMLSDLRDSGAIEQDADVVMFIYRDHVYDQKADERAAEIIIAKQREGQDGPVCVGFDRTHTRFYDLADEDHGRPNWDGQHDYPGAQA
jgi:replicative DNA helicase